MLAAVSYVVTAIGVILALALKRTGSPVYARIGRRVD
jgi:hypothetical protein